MENDSFIKQTLLAYGVNLIGELTPDKIVDDGVLAFIEVNRSDVGSQVPSNFQLRKIIEFFENEGIFVQLVLVENGAEDIQASIKSMVFRYFPELIKNVSASFDNKGVIVWLEPKHKFEEYEMLLLEKKMQQLLDVLNIKLLGVKFINVENLPTKTALLKYIRQYAPITQAILAVKLTERKFVIPNDDWLSNALDSLRKSQFIFRNKKGDYIVTFIGLVALGSDKDRRSPDINRLLDLARRRS